MSRARKGDKDLDCVIDEITVDAYGEDEQPMGLQNAFEEDANFPCRGRVVGEDVDVLSVSLGDHRRELIATCERAGR